MSEILRRVPVKPEAMAVMVHAEEDYTKLAAVGHPE